MSEDQTRGKAWIENQILYYQFYELSLEAISEATQQAKELIAQQVTGFIPNIILLDQLDESHVLLKPTQLGKAIGSRDIMKQLSGMWIVGAGTKVKTLGNIANRFFFNGRMQFVDTREEAEKAAGASDRSRGFLEPDA